MACAKAGVPVEVVPGVSAVSAVPAYAGVPLTTAESSAVHVIATPAAPRGARPPSTRLPGSTLHGRRPRQRRGARCRTGCAPGGRPRRGHSCRGHRHGTSVRQSTAVTTLEDATAAVESAPTPALAVVGPTVDLRQTINWFESRPLFGWNVLVPRTKEQSRVHRPAAVPMARDFHGGAHHQRRTPAHPAADGARDHGPGHRSLRVGRVHFRQRRQGRAGALEVLGLDVRSFAGPKVAAVVASPPRRCVTGGSSPTRADGGAVRTRPSSEEWPPTTTRSTRSPNLLPRG